MPEEARDLLERLHVSIRELADAQQRCEPAAQVDALMRAARQLSVQALVAVRPASGPLTYVQLTPDLDGEQGWTAQLSGPLALELAQLRPRALFLAMTRGRPLRYAVGAQGIVGHVSVPDAHRARFGVVDCV